MLERLEEGRELPDSSGRGWKSPIECVPSLTLTEAVHKEHVQNINRASAKPEQVRKISVLVPPLRCTINIYLYIYIYIYIYIYVIAIVSAF